MTAKVTKKARGPIPRPEPVPVSLEVTPGGQGDLGRGPDSHVELSGMLLRFPRPAPEVTRFLERVRRMVEASDMAPEQVRAFVFGPENPILARHPTLPGAYPDAATVRNPLYWVCVDWVLRAEARHAGVSAETAGVRFTTSIPEAADRLGRYRSTIQNAIENRTLHVWVQEGRYYLLPEEVAAYDVPRRGRPSKKKPKRSR